MRKFPIHHWPAGSAFLNWSFRTLLAFLHSALPPKFDLLGPLHKLMSRHSMNCLKEKDVNSTFLGCLGYMFCPLLQSSLALSSIILHWISEIEYVLQKVKMTMYLTCVTINSFVATVNVRIEKPEKLSYTSVEYFRFASCFQGEFFGIMQIRMKTQSQLYE
jgi:hypothetical protein